jgi:hypothetical protein
MEFDNDPARASCCYEDVMDESNEALAPNRSTTADRDLALAGTHSRLAVQRQTKGVVEAPSEETATARSSAIGPIQSWSSAPTIRRGIEVNPMLCWLWTSEKPD